MVRLSSSILSLSPEEGDQDNIKEQQPHEEEQQQEGALDGQKCRAALASLRHTKWFQVS